MKNVPQDSAQVLAQPPSRMRNMSTPVVRRNSGWTRVGDMSVERMGHTATMLPTGKVLLYGGIAIVAPCKLGVLDSVGAAIW
jgi:hypothetical protein